MPRTIDFSALSPRKKSPSIIVIIILTIGMLLLVSLIFIIPSQIVVTTFQYGSFVLIAAAVIAQIRQERRKATRLELFARSNGFGYQLSSTSINGNGTIFSHGHSRRLRNIFSGELENMAFRYYDYRYVTGHGKYSHTFELSVMEFTIPHQLPHFVIDSLVEPQNYGSSVLPIQFSQNQRINLEGEFSRYFSLYAPDRQAVSALTLLAPDAMAVLMQHGAACDIEIVGDKVYLYWADTAADPNSMQEKFTTAQEVIRVMSRNLRAAALDSTFTAAPQLSSSPLAQITNSGNRLSWIGMVAFIIILTIQTLVIFYEPSLVLYAIALYLVFPIYFIIKVIIKRRRRSAYLYSKRSFDN